jgi:hypothetical protein
MVITPKEAKELSAEEKANVKNLEIRIDKALQEQRLTFAINHFPSSKVREQIIRLYRGAGWNVEYISDQRDGDYLQFSENQNQPYWDR